MRKALSIIAQSAKLASAKMALASSEQKTEALFLMAEGLEKGQAAIQAANDQDMHLAKKAGLASSWLDRLSLSGRFHSIVEDMRRIAELEDPVGEVIETRALPSGLKLKKIRVPIGVIGVIYEARPNVTVDVASLILKTGNCAILRGGSETLNTNRALVEAMEKGLSQSRMPKNCIQFIQTPEREIVKSLLTLDSEIDMIIPRGGGPLHQFCKENSTIPVITGGIGICHLFVDASADQKRACLVVLNAKTERPSVCNALDTLLVHQDIAPDFLPKMAALLNNSGVSLRLDSRSSSILGPGYPIAREEDWKTEWLSLVLGIRIVDSLEDAISHIRTYGSGHSDGILTETEENKINFLKQVDSAVVYVNASTRFTDGGQFGMGAEVAISTQKLHARGPMGLEALTTYKWIAEGDYLTR